MSRDQAREGMGRVGVLIHPYVADDGERLQGCHGDWVVPYSIRFGIAHRSAGETP